jgi:hypothetical protein
MYNTMIHKWGFVCIGNWPGNVGQSVRDKDRGAPHAGHLSLKIPRSGKSSAETYEYGCKD